MIKARQQWQLLRWLFLGPNYEGLLEEADTVCNDQSNPGEIQPSESSFVAEFVLRTLPVAQPALHPLLYLSPTSSPFLSQKKKDPVTFHVVSALRQRIRFSSAWLFRPLLLHWQRGWSVPLPTPSLHPAPSPSRIWTPPHRSFLLYASAIWLILPYPRSQIHSACYTKWSLLWADQDL